MLSIARLHCILTISHDFYPKIWGDLKRRLDLSTAAKSTKSI